MTSDRFGYIPRKYRRLSSANKIFRRNDFGTGSDMWAPSPVSQLPTDFWYVKGRNQAPIDGTGDSGLGRGADSQK